MASTLNEYYTSQGKSLPAISERAKTYESMGLGSAASYQGTSQQNTALLGKLTGGGGSTTQTSNFQNKDEVQNYTNNVQNNYLATLNSNSGPSLEFDTNSLVQALVTKGGYNQTDAENAAKGSRATELAKEFLGIGGAESGSLISNNEIPTVSMETIQSYLPSGEAPAAINRNELLNQYRIDMGVESLETNLNDLSAQEEEAYANLESTKASERGKAVPLGVMEGRISEETRMAQENLEFIQRQKTRVVNELNTKYSIINTYVTNDALDYQDAVKAYDTKFTQGLSLFETIWGVTKDQWNMKQQQQATASTNLGLYVNAITSGNLTYSNLSNDQKLQISKLETQAGLPIGFVSSLQMSAKDQIAFTSTNDGITQVGFIDPTTKQITVKTYGTATPKKATESEKKASAIGAMESKLSQLGGSDQLVSPAEYKAQKSIWLQAGYSADDFDNNFRTNHVDESHPADYGLKSYTASNQPTIIINK